MAVSKIAVMALVGILAVPILLGYAFNLNETTVTEYKPEGESVNVTELLQNGSAFHYTHANDYQLNTNFKNQGNQTIKPMYENYSSIKTTYPSSIRTGSNSVPSETFTFPTYNPFFIQFDYNFTGSSDIRMNMDWDGNIGGLVGQIHSVNYDDANNVLEVCCYHYDTSIGGFLYYNYNNPQSITFFINGSLSFTYYTVGLYPSDADNAYIDLSAGFKIYGLYNVVVMPNETKSVTFTVDLSTMTVTNSHLWFASVNGNGNSNTPAFMIEKLSNGTYSMRVNSFNSPNPQTILYTDPTRSENVYQFTISKEYLGSFDDNGITRYKWNNYVSADYVGNWPTIIGKANSFWHFEYQEIHNQSIDDYIGGVKINVQNTDLSPKIRFDDAYYNGFAYPIVEDQTYNPSNFKTNPTTTISNVQKFGYSLEFGGNSYQVDSTGNITLGTHKISVNGLKLESIPVPVGYENKINGNVVSVTAQPSDIKFIGQWGASISTVGNSAATVTKTEWTAGSFAWDGMDTNFLIVGLITCLGVFIALGIYARKTGKGVIPLLIVCGGAAALFICMI